MSEKLQEWIEAVERAVDEPQVEAALLRARMTYYREGSLSYRQCLARATNAETQATRLAELAAYLRDGGWLPIESADHNHEPRLFGWWDGGAWVVSASTFWDGSEWWDDRDHRGPVQPPVWQPLPAPPAALATPGGEE